MNGSFFSTLGTAALATCAAAAADGKSEAGELCGCDGFLDSNCGVGSGMARDRRVAISCNAF